MSASLPKSERLSGKTAVGTLVAKGRWGTAGHFKYCVMDSPAEASRIIVSVPKKFFKRAVKRNLLKRRTREAYRLQKDLLGAPHDILFAYNSAEIADFPTIKGEIRTILESI